MSQAATEPESDRDQRSRGRPKKAEAKRRSERVTVRLSKAELAQVDAKASRAGRPVSTYLREAGLGKRLATAEERADRDETIRQLSRIGNNLNQIARALNKGRGMESGHLRDATDELEKALKRV